MKKCQIIILVILILILAGFFRLYSLNSIPSGLYPDEAMNGNDAINAINTNKYKLFYPENNGREGLFVNLIALSFQIFGVHIWSLKLIGALAGILTVLGLYFLTKELFNSAPIALLASFFLAISFWHVNFSRIGFRGILVPFFLVWSFYFFFKLYKTKPKKYLQIIIYCLLSGVFFGLGFYTYIAFRIAVLILLVPLIIILIKFLKEYKKTNKFWKSCFEKGFWRYALLLILILIVALPMGIYFINNSSHFMSRAGGVSIFAQDNPFLSFIKSTGKTLGMFNIAGDKNWRHNFSNSPQLLFPIGIFFLIGLAVSIKRLIKSRNNILSYSLLIAWFIAMLLPAILTYEGIPHALRTIGVIPVCYIFAGLGAWILYKYLYKFIKQKRLNKILLIVVCILFLFTFTYDQADKYFVDWAKQPSVKGAFAQNYVEIGNYLNSFPIQVKKYVLVNKKGDPYYGLSIPAQTPIFIERTKFNTSRTTYLPWQEIDQIEISYPKTVILSLYNHNTLEDLQKKFPQGKIIINNPYGIEIK